MSVKSQGMIQERLYRCRIKIRAAQGYVFVNSDRLDHLVEKGGKRWWFGATGDLTCLQCSINFPRLPFRKTVALGCGRGLAERAAWLANPCGSRRKIDVCRGDHAMPDRLQAWLHTSMGRTTVTAIMIMALVGVAWSMMRYFGPNSAQRYSGSPLFIDSATGKTFHYQLKIGDTIPVLSPFTHRHTGYPASFSYWSKSGHILERPEPELLNSWLGKKTPTFAPLSGRLVTANEKPPRPGAAPPPTKAQYEKWLHQYQVESNGGS